MAAVRRVLLAGGAGYVGSHTAKLLWQRGIEPVVYDNLSTGHRWAVKWGEFVHGELSDTERLREVLRRDIDAVMHFAAHIEVGESIRNPGQYFRNNLVYTLGLLDAMLECDVNRFVFSSTAAVYGNPERVPLTEDHPKLPVNPYGETKLCVERALRWYGQAYALQWMSLRYFNASGADADGEIGEDHDPESHLIPILLAAARGERNKASIFGTDYPTEDGTAIRDYIHVVDLADAHARALDHMASAKPSMALNVGTGKGHSVLEVVRAVEGVIKRRLPVEHGPRRAGDPPVLVADAQRAREVLGWKPECSDLDSIVQSAWQWHSVGLPALRRDAS